MFRCEQCGVNVAHHVSAQRIVIATRHKQYPHRREVHKSFRIDSVGRIKTVWKDDPGGEGEEIVAELTVCPACYAESEPVEAGEPKPKSDRTASYLARGFYKS